MRKHPRFGIRTRLLLAVVGAVSVALVIGVAAFNLLLDQRLTASAISLAHDQAAAAAVDGRRPRREARHV